ncbi:MAG TPA: class I SAM-dependent methyltransferase [Actinospica sp.]|jgi:ubiquinone/menaquinone biosynthesis C-methylase UbiE|nr:class I SAM-dependent methyltransferase [Actinospica sp.]
MADTSASESFDGLHTRTNIGDLQKRLLAQAWGDEYPAEVDPSSSCTWSVLGEMVRRLHLRPDDLLIDLGCGRGGTGLWLARAFSARLIGIDFSPVGIELAAARIPGFLPEGRAEFRVGTFEAIGLPDACADGLVSMDALPFAKDPDAALREIARILRPGAPAVFTTVERLPGHPLHDPDAPSWPERIDRAGLLLEAEMERPEELVLWRSIFDLWDRHEAELRAELGDAAAEPLLEESRTAGPHLHLRRPFLLTVRAA